MWDSKDIFRKKKELLPLYEGLCDSFGYLEVNSIYSM